MLLNCPTAVSATIGPDETTTPVTWTPPTATDNSGVVTVTGNLMPGVMLTQNIHIVIYIALDASGNSDSCNFVITVSGKLIAWLKKKSNTKSLMVLDIHCLI